MNIGPQSHRQAVRLLQTGIGGLVATLLFDLFVSGIPGKIVFVVILGGLSAIAMLWGLVWLTMHPVRRHN